jgi:serine/threonine-protein kinase
MSSLPLVGTEWAGYRLRAVLGRGGMSTVYKAEHPRLGSTVALKVMAPELASDDIFRTRFLEESRTAAALNHPNVIPIYDMGPCEDLLFLAMRYVAGADMRAMLRAQRTLAPDRALFLIEQTARALDAAHRRGLVHRDVKPGNILVERADDNDDPDHVYLADFGITKHVTSRSGLTSTGQLMGTIDYVAPEQIQARPVDGRTDLYSLGCVMYECLTGSVPFVKDIDAAVLWAHVEEVPPMPSALQPELPRAIDDVIMRALAKEPADRYGSCRELVTEAQSALRGAAAPPTTQTDLRSALRSEAPRSERPGREPPGGGPPREQTTADISPPGAGQPGAGPSTPGREPARRNSRRRLAIAAAAVVLIAAAVAGVLAATSGTTAKSTAAAGAAKPKATAVSPAMKKPSPQPTTNSLLKALAETNQSQPALGLIPPRTCKVKGESQVTCTDPAFGVSQAVFRTYPSLTALYNAYTAEVKEANGGRYQANVNDCREHETSGEVTWNHDYQHLLNYSLADVESGKLGDEQAAGRLFCTLTNGQYMMIWTQNDGRMLAYLHSGFHANAYEWWYPVHHNIDLTGGMGMGM